MGRIGRLEDLRCINHHVEVKYVLLYALSPSLKVDEAASKGKRRQVLTTSKITNSGDLEELVVLLHLTGLTMLGHLGVQMAEVHGLGLARRHRAGDV